MLEEQNSGYESTIDLLHQKLSNMRGMNNSVQRQDHCVESLNDRIQQLETSMTNKLDLLKLELQHQLTVQELNLRHQLPHMCQTCRTCRTIVIYLRHLHIYHNRTS